MSVFLTSFCGGVVGGALIALYHISRYKRLVDITEQGLREVQISNNRIVRSLNERIALLEEERRARH